MANNVTIETLIENSLKELLRIGKEDEIQQNADSRLIFPKYRNREKRVSEQELRFLLIRELEKQKEFYYSVETPTKEEYFFSGSIENSLSARIDLCLHNSEGKRINLIELKYDNVDVRNDFLKLLCDCETEQNYFVQFVGNADDRTFTSIKSKYEEALKYILDEKFKIKSGVKIFLFVVKTESLHKYEINRDGSLNKVED
jgi:hypothetical protein